jgi:hypothetical protein
VRRRLERELGAARGELSRLRAFKEHITSAVKVPPEPPNLRTQSTPRAVCIVRRWRANPPAAAKVEHDVTREHGLSRLCASAGDAKDAQADATVRTWVGGSSLVGSDKCENGGRVLEIGGPRRAWPGGVAARGTERMQVCRGAWTRVTLDYDTCHG